MIRSFADDATERLFQQEPGGPFPRDIQSRALRKLQMVHAAADIRDLFVPPGNRLEKLEGDRAGQWSIRINDQWRICFRWEAGSADDVEICDYH